jgi:hypothetical protein
MHLASVLASIALFVPVPPGVHVVMRGCPGDPTISCADGNRTIYLRPADLRAGYPDAHLMLAHELGHIWDLERFTDTDRGHYRTVLGLGRSDWFPGLDNEVTPDGVLAPAEYFADAYALCSMSPRYRRWLRRHGGYYGTYGERVRRRDLAITCWMIDQQSSPTGSSHWLGA